MSDPFVENLNENTDPQPGDWLHVVDDSAAANDKDRKLNISLLAILAAANTFTANQTINGALDVDSQDINTAAATFRGEAGQTAPIVDVRDSANAQMCAILPSGIIDQSQGLRLRGSQYEAFRRRSDTVSVSTSAVTILNIGTRMGVVHVYGKSGSVYFSDLVMFMSAGGGAQATSIGTVEFGGPAARTYSSSSNDLRLAMASGTYDVQAVCISRIADP